MLTDPPLPEPPRVRVDEHPPHIRVDVVSPPHPPPRGVDARQRGLRQVLGEVRIPGQEECGPHQHRPPHRHVGRELTIGVAGGIAISRALSRSRAVRAPGRSSSHHDPLPHYLEHEGGGGGCRLGVADVVVVVVVDAVCFSVRFVCGFSRLFTASRMVLRPLASPARVGALRQGRGSSLDQELQAFAPKGGARCLRRRLRGERPRLRGGGVALLGGGRCLWSPRPGFPVASSPDGSRPAWRRQAASPPLWSGCVRLDPASPVSLAAPADATGNPGQPHLCGGSTCHTARRVLLHRSRTRRGTRAPRRRPAHGARLLLHRLADDRQPPTQPRHAQPHRATPPGHRTTRGAVKSS